MENADFSEANFDFNVDAAATLEYKHLLAQLVKRYCPQLMPQTYCMNDQNWPRMISHVRNTFYTNKPQDPGLVWILKPALLNNGEAIKIFESINELELHFACSKRLGGEHVLQQYIMNPHLLRDERKYSIRQFMVLTNYKGAFLYRHGYFNVALKRFSRVDFTDLSPHLTNEHLNHHQANVIQIPTNQFAWYNNLYPQIKDILMAVIGALRQEYPEAFICKKQPAMALFGMDFMVDDAAKVWLLEANHGPCFPVNQDHPLQRYLYNDFWMALINQFVFPLVGKETAVDKENFDLI